MSSVSCDSLDPSGLVSPCSTVRSLTKDLQHSLDLASATSGDKVVTAQVSEAAVHQELTQSCLIMSSARIYCIIAFCFLFTMDVFLFSQENEGEQASTQSGGQTPGPQRPRSNSGRELTDEVRLAL